MSTAARSLRLDRLLGNLGYGSRREIGEMVRHGRVLLDGKPVTASDGRVALAPDLPGRLRVDGDPLDPLPGLVVLMNKPLGVTCSHKEAGRLVYGLLPPRWRLRDPAISSIGRLDKETSGLLLLTDDGDLLHRIIAPKTHLPKRYLATLARPVEAGVAALFAAGTLMLDGETRPLLPGQLDLLSPTHVALTVTEGRYHQVRRMFAAVGNYVETLHRDQMGGLRLPDDLAPGHYRLATAEEIGLLFAKPGPAKG